MFHPPPIASCLDAALLTAEEVEVIRQQVTERVRQRREAVQKAAAEKLRLAAEAAAFELETAAIEAKVEALRPALEELQSVTLERKRLVRKFQINCYLATKRPKPVPNNIALEGAEETEEEEILREVVERVSRMHEDRQWRRLCQPRLEALEAVFQEQDAALQAKMEALQPAVAEFNRLLREMSRLHIRYRRATRIV